MATSFARNFAMRRAAYTKESLTLQPRIYRPTSGRSLFLISAGLAIIVAAVLGLWHPADPLSGFFWGTFSYVSVCSCGILIGLFAALVPFRTRLILCEDQIELHAVIRTRVVKTAEITGYRDDGSGVLSLRTERRTVFFGYPFRLDDQFYVWLNQFEKLDFQSGRVGHVSTIALAFAMCAVNAWGKGSPRPSDFLIVALIALPWMALLMPARMKAILRLPVSSSLVLALLCGYALALRANTDFKLLIWHRAILPALSLAGLLFLAFLRSDKTLQRNWGIALGLCVVSGLYGYGAAIETNALLDRSTPRTMATRVLGFRNTRGGTGYEIDLSPLSAGTQEAKVPVSLNVYSRVQLNQAVCVQLKSGALGIPWYEVSLCK